MPFDGKYHSLPSPKDGLGGLADGQAHPLGVWKVETAEGHQSLGRFPT